MRHEIQAHDLSRRDYKVAFDTWPDTCPICHLGVQPRLIAATVKLAEESLKMRLQIMYQCPRLDCQEMFIATYLHIGKSTSERIFKLQYVKPIEPYEVPVSDLIKDLSPNFFDIYQQSIAAEAAGLHHLTGIGLRKALEFLVKDFSCEEHPQDQEIIKAKRLGNCIQDYLSDPNLQKTAKRAAWLGNDETHYIRKWDKDIEDLKLLIKLTMNWAENVLMTKKYESEMPE